MGSNFVAEQALNVLVIRRPLILAKLDCGLVECFLKSHKDLVHHLVS